MKKARTVKGTPAANKKGVAATQRSKMAKKGCKKALNRWAK